MIRLEDQLKELAEDQLVNLVYDGHMIKNFAGTLLRLLNDKVLQGIVHTIKWECGVFAVTLEVMPREENDQDE